MAAAFAGKASLSTARFTATELLFSFGYRYNEYNTYHIRFTQNSLLNNTRPLLQYIYNKICIGTLQFKGSFNDTNLKEKLDTPRNFRIFEQWQILNAVSNNSCSNADLIAALPGSMAAIV